MHLRPQGYRSHGDEMYNLQFPGLAYGGVKLRYGNPCPQ
ncbi:hypothetical protein BPA30113_07522 [Burkholderia paludis]|uniref:Uncharacterized protein n=1 Tax=Burkholderia paludis TaxID=1506587 RepID=A0A6J5F8Q4_9BURK|nr:hypothetical protein LMG30113_07490 [Burkholderia paludis]VWC48461.1 hypothetical protein BPA30113_07522 [Burkholderia paludis]